MGAQAIRHCHFPTGSLAPPPRRRSCQEMRLSWADPTISDFELFLDAQADARSDAFESQLAKPPKQEAVDAGTRPVEPNFRKSKAETSAGRLRADGLWLLWAFRAPSSAETQSAYGARRAERHAVTPAAVPSSNPLKPGSRPADANLDVPTCGSAGHGCGPEQSPNTTGDGMGGRQPIPTWGAGPSQQACCPASPDALVFRSTDVRFEKMRAHTGIEAIGSLALWL